MFSVVIPIGPSELAWQKLLGSLLRSLPEDSEIILVVCDESRVGEFKDADKRVKVVVSEVGRAKALNCGAKSAGGRFLWFLHADSVVDEGAVEALVTEIRDKPKRLLYFRLKFDDRFFLMRLTEFGVRFRSEVLRIPFGDQGFCIDRELFFQLGGFPEYVAYGEDHVFLWRARQAGVGLFVIKSGIVTSTRKYKKQGWFYVTFKHQFLWMFQAVPQFLKFVASRL